ncbi:MAPEG family protein [Paracoccus sp. PARArs4]|uniref:MAPEG family protein n=1 Tax=Paracoccus sp. PARArs4 TaxID=2853442 RepID=UPI0024A75907|nr:MAPEG family protein [Paracoccus sp. PARArs4]
MTPELTVLALAGLLQFGQFVAYSVEAQKTVGRRVAMGPRDDVAGKPLPGRAGRLQRALNNHFEGLIMFTLAVVVVTMGQQGSFFTALMAWIYLGARILYVPAYVLGWVPGRSLIWSVGMGATVLMILAALF